MAEEPTNQYTFETHYKIYDDVNGGYTKIGPDRDGLELIEIRRVDSEGEELPAIVLTLEEAPLIVEAIAKVVHTLRAAKLNHCGTVQKEE